MGLPALIFFPFFFETLRAQGVAREGAVCQPASQRNQELGCWILADDPVGQLTKQQVFWHLETYPTDAAAHADKGSRGIVLDSFGKIWLMTIGYEKSTTTHGGHVADIGPIPITAGKQYSAQFMEAIFTPGMMAPEHLHSGPEVWFTLAGQTCLETSDGNVQVGRAGGPPVIVPEGLSMHLTATGTELRKALVLILHDSSKPPSTTVHDWTAKGLCKNKD
jgi:hypothetical protein